VYICPGICGCSRNKGESKMKKVLAGLLTFLVLAMVLAGCMQQAQKTSVADSDLSYIKGKGEMIIGITLFAPMNYEKDGELIGFETEFAKAVCEKMGVTPKFQEINWDSKEIELNAKNIDCVWNGMTITEDRKANMEITNPYMSNRQVMVVKSSDLKKYSESVNSANVVAEQGSAGEELVQSEEFFKGVKYTAVDSQAKALLDVASGTSDVAVVDYVTSIGSIGEGTDYSNLVVVGNKKFAEEEYGIAFRKGSDIVPEVNKIISQLFNDGTIGKIAEKYKLNELIIQN
jgi:polar amino acid transport system substrate-binding protein